MGDEDEVGAEADSIREKCLEYLNDVEPNLQKKLAERQKRVHAACEAINVNHKTLLEKIEAMKSKALTDIVASINPKVLVECCRQTEETRRRVTQAKSEEEVKKVAEELADCSQKWTEEANATHALANRFEYVACRELAAIHKYLDMLVYKSAVVEVKTRSRAKDGNVPGPSDSSSARPTSAASSNADQPMVVNGHKQSIEENDDELESMRSISPDVNEVSSNKVPTAASFGSPNAVNGNKGPTTSKPSTSPTMDAMTDGFDRSVRVADNAASTKITIRNDRVSNGVSPNKPSYSMREMLQLKPLAMDNTLPEHVRNTCPEIIVKNRKSPDGKRVDDKRWERKVAQTPRPIAPSSNPVPRPPVTGPTRGASLFSTRFPPPSQMMPQPNTSVIPPPPVIPNGASFTTRAKLAAQFPPPAGNAFGCGIAPITAEAQQMLSRAQTFSPNTSQATVISNSKNRYLQELKLQWKEIYKKFKDEERLMDVVDSCGRQERKALVSLRPNLMNIVEQSRAATKGLYCKLIHMIKDDGLDGPIGCAYNDSTKQWIVCNTKRDMVHVYDSTYRRTHVLVKPNNKRFSQPSAVIFSTDLENFAVKDDSRVCLFSSVTFEYVGEIPLETKTKLMCLSGSFDEEVPESPECLITLQDGFQGSAARVSVIEPISKKVVRRLDYDGAKDSNRPDKSKPRFMDWHSNGILAISDLGLHMVYVISCIDGSILHKIGTGDPGRLPGQLSFPSGVRHDCEANLLVGDAKNNRVQLFDCAGEFVCVLQFEQPDGKTSTFFPFPSDLHLTNDGQLMVMSRAHNCCGIYQIMPL